MVLASQVVQVEDRKKKHAKPSSSSDEDAANDGDGKAVDVLYVDDEKRHRGREFSGKRKSEKSSFRIDESISKLSRRDETRKVRHRVVNDDKTEKQSSSIAGGTEGSKTKARSSSRSAHLHERRLSPLSIDSDEDSRSLRRHNKRRNDRDEQPSPFRSSRTDDRSSHRKIPGDKHVVKELPRQRTSGKNDPAAVADDTGDVLSVAETNKIRAKLGLSLLPTSGVANDASKASDAVSAYEQRAEVHAPPANFNQKREHEALREKIQTMRERRDLERRLLVDKRTGKFESIGTSISSSAKHQSHNTSSSRRSASAAAQNEDDDDDVKNWVKKSRLLAVEKQKAAERERQMQEMDSDLGITDLVNAEITKTADQYVNVGDLRVEHDLSAVRDRDQPMVLTLKDAPVLKPQRTALSASATADDADEEDILINVDMVDAEKTAANVATRRKMPKNHNPFDEASERWYGAGQAEGAEQKNVLSKYDEEIEGQKKKYFRLGWATTNEAVETAKLEVNRKAVADDDDDENQPAAMETDDGGHSRAGGVRFAVASDYMDADEARTKSSEEVKFKKAGKKKKSSSSGATAAAGRSSRKAGKRLGEILLDDDGDFDDRNDVEANKTVVADDDGDDDYADVQKFLQRHRVTKNTHNADEIMLKPKVEAESFQDYFAPSHVDEEHSDVKPFVGGGIILDDTSEFCRNIGDFKGDDDDDVQEIDAEEQHPVAVDKKLKSTKTKSRKHRGDKLDEISADERENMLVDDEPKRTLDDFAKQYNSMGSTISSGGKAVAAASATAGGADGGGGSWQEAAFETEQPELERHFRGRRQYRQQQQSSSSSSRAAHPPRVGSEEGQIEDDDETTSSNAGDDVDSTENHAVLDAEPKIGKGLASALNLVVRKNLIDAKSGRQGNRLVIGSQRRQTGIEAKSFITEDKRFDTIDDKRRGGGGGGGGHGFMRSHGPVETFRDNKQHVKFKLDLVARDADGRELSQRESFQQLSHIFHGKRPGKSKGEKRQKKSAETLIMQKMSATDTPLGTVGKMMSKQKSTGCPYIILSGGGGDGKSGGIADLVKDSKSFK